MKRLLFTGMLFTLVFDLHAQLVVLKIDSLTHELNQAVGDTHRVSLLNQLAILLIEAKQLDKAEHVSGEALLLAESLSFLCGQAKSYYTTGMLLMARKDEENAIKHFLQAIQFSKECNDETSTAYYCQKLGRTYESLGQKDKALEAYDEALLQYRKKAMKQQEAGALLDIGAVHNTYRNFEMAMVHFQNAKKLYEELHDLKGLANSLNNIANVYDNLEDYDQALSFFHSSLEIKTELQDSQAMASTLHNIGNVYYRQGQYDTALQYYRQSEEIKKSKGDKPGLIASYMSIGSIYRIKGQYEEAYAMYEKGMMLAEELNDLNKIAKLKSNMGNLKASMGEYSEAIDLYKSSLETAKRYGDKASEGGLYNQLGMVLMIKGDYAQSLTYLDTSIQIAQTARDKATLIRAYHNMSTVYQEMGDFPKALHSSLLGYQIAEELKNSPMMMSNHMNLGRLYMRMGDYPSAMEHFEENLKLNATIGDMAQKAQVYQFISFIYREESKYSDALEYEQRSHDLYSSLGDENGLATSLANMAMIMEDQGQDAEALLFYQKALALYNKLGNKSQVAATYLSIGKLKLNNTTDPDPIVLQTAITYLDSSLILGRETGALPIVRDAYEALAKAYANQHLYQKALEYQSLYITLKDSLLNNETTRQLEQLRTQYEVEKAVAAEKAHQDSLLASQKFQSEIELAERTARHQMEIAEAKAQEGRAVEAARYRYLLQLAAAKTEQEKQLAEQQYQNDLRIAEESARHRIALADERVKQEEKEAKAQADKLREKQQRERRAEMALSGGGLVVLLSVFFLMYQRQRNLKQKAIERADTIHKMTELELQSLRAQLNPHFMFNSLNAIQELILLEENDKSHTYLARFAKLLRMLLENANNPLIPLARELEFLQLYLSLEKLRIPELQYAILVAPDIETEQTRIPNMILQPYIENAIWHGLSPKQGKKKLDIRVEKQNGSVVYEIEDNGIGRQKAAELKSQFRKEHKSKGMELLTKRFKLLSKEYGSEITTTITDVLQDGQIGGTKVTITVPVSILEKAALVEN